MKKTARNTRRLLSALLSLAMIAAMLTSAFPFVTATAEAGYYLLGDVNDDGVLSSTDLTRLMKHLAGETVDISTAIADLTSDGTVDSTDLVRLIKNIAEGTVEQMPIPGYNDPTLTLVEGGTLKLKRIVYGSGVSDIYKDAANELAEKINAITATLGVTEAVEAVFFNSYAGNNYKPEDVEIYIGYVDHPEMDKGDIGYGDYSLNAVGNKITLFGYGYDVIDQAVLDLEALLTAGANTETGALVLDKAAVNRKVTANALLAAVPMFVGGGEAYNYRVGNGSYEMVVPYTSPELYSAYLELLEASGYTKVTSSSITNNEFAVYNGAEYTVNVGYYGFSELVRIIVEPLAEAFGLEADNQYKTVTTPLITELGIGRTYSDGSSSNNGACVIFRLSDGRFIIIDGGHSSKEEANQILEELKREAADYAEESEIKVAAWIITHGHGDHAGLFKGRSSAFKNITVENVIVNFSHIDERIRAYSPEDNEAGYAYEEAENEAEIVSTAIEKYGAAVRIARPGSTYYLADAKIETLYTSDMHDIQMPFSSYNSTSIIMKITIGGKVFMSLGDATWEILRQCDDHYGDYLKSDIVQIPHHGFTIGGKEAAVLKPLYQHMAPSIVFFTIGAKAFPSYVSNDHNIFVTSAEHNPNIVDVFNSGDVGDRVTIPADYVPGSGTADIVVSGLIFDAE